MSRFKEAEPKLNLSTQTRLATLLIFLTGTYLYSQNAGVVQNTDPIRIPADAERIDKKNNYMTSFRMKAIEAASVFCGKVSLKLQPDYDVRKTVTELDNGQARVDCETLGYDIPTERNTPQE